MQVSLDTYFSDNQQREVRAKELARDCQNYSFKLFSTTKEIQDNLLVLNSDIAKIYCDPAKLPQNAQPETIKFNDMVLVLAAIYLARERLVQLQVSLPLVFHLGLEQSLEQSNVINYVMPFIQDLVHAHAW